MDDLSDLLSVAATAADDGSRGAHTLSEESEEKKTNAETAHLVDRLVVRAYVMEEACSAFSDPTVVRVSIIYTCTAAGLRCFLRSFVLFCSVDHKR